jgi:peptidoglycan/LPS O-acetylase OafA/YrhL
MICERTCRDRIGRQKFVSAQIRDAAMKQPHGEPTPYDVIDLFRAVAAYVVLISHVRQLIVSDIGNDGSVNWAINFVLSLGQDAVLVFFVISGFWIVRSVVRAGPDFIWSQYLLARLSRLWLVLIPAVIIGGLLDFIGIGLTSAGVYQGTQGNLAVGYDVASRLTWQNFGSSILFLQTLVGEPFGSNGPLWSLAYEFWYYILFPSLWLALRHHRLSLFLPLSCGIALLFPQILPGFVIWCFGGIVYWLTERGALAGTMKRFGGLAVVISVGIFLAAILASHALDLAWRAGNFMVGASFALLTFTVLQTGFTLPKATLFISRFGANGSYSLYVTHFPVVIFIAAFLVPETRLSVSPLSWLLVLVLTVPPVFIADLFAYFTEHRTVAVRRRVSDLTARIRTTFPAKTITRASGRGER